MSSDKSILEYYNSKAKDFVSDTVAVAFTEIQDIFLEYIPVGGKILDFGCGSGRDTRYFISKGYDVDAIDGSEELCKIAMMTAIHLWQCIGSIDSIEWLGDITIFTECRCRILLLMYAATLIVPIWQNRE